MIITFESRLTDKGPRLALLQNILKHSNLEILKIRERLLSADHISTSLYLGATVPKALLSQCRAQLGAVTVTPYRNDYWLTGRHLETDTLDVGFTYQGLTFSQNSFHVFAGLCAVDNRLHVEQMMQALQSAGQVCTRMGAYKPRTSPYTFQGHGASCLPYVFELAGRYGIKVIAMEVLCEQGVAEITQALAQAGNPCGVILQVGTRNCQNMALLRAVGQQQRFPVLLKRGFGISLQESLLAAEHIAREGNDQIIFCLRGVKSVFAAPHRNLVDFGQVSLIKRLTTLGVCVDPSHSAGLRDAGLDGLSDIAHVTAQGVIAGANMVLVDFHPDSQKALVDGHQALCIKQLPWYLEDIAIAREAYLKRCALVRSYQQEPACAL